MALGQVLSKYFSYPCHSFHRLLHTHLHPLSRAGTIGQIMTDVPSGFSPTPPREKKKNVWFYPWDWEIRSRAIPDITARSLEVPREICNNKELTERREKYSTKWRLFTLLKSSKSHGLIPPSFQLFPSLTLLTTEDVSQTSFPSVIMVWFSCTVSSPRRQNFSTSQWIP
jgi:hypothetical protein